jgi:hypothetical protein
VCARSGMRERLQGVTERIQEYQGCNLGRRGNLSIFIVWMKICMDPLIKLVSDINLLKFESVVSKKTFYPLIYSLTVATSRLSMQSTNSSHYARAARRVSVAVAGFTGLCIGVVGAMGSSSDVGTSGRSNSTSLDSDTLVVGTSSSNSIPMPLINPFNSSNNSASSS